MAYTTIKKPSDYFRIKTYTGDSTDNRSITWDETDTNFGTNLLLWLKQRTVAAQEHWLTDSVRGATKFLESNSTNAEVDAGGNFAYTTNGFVVDDTARTNRGTMVGWGWNTSGSASSNTDGSITSTVSANTTSGFSIVSYTGTGSTTTVGHGLGAKPSIVIYKQRNTTNSWRVMHDIGGTLKRIYLNASDAEASIIDSSTAPTSTVLNIGTGSEVNTSGGTYIAYCFAEVKGFSKFGSYVGNGSTDGTFIYTGFKPSWFMCKKTDTENGWNIFDNKRSISGGFNVIDYNLYANLSDVEDTATNYNSVDFLSNGIKCRQGNGGLNASGGSYIYMAFAEEPLVGDNPATAR
jgi:hypothetical protein